MNWSLVTPLSLQKILVFSKQSFKILTHRLYLLLLTFLSIHHHSYFLLFRLLRKTFSSNKVPNSLAICFKFWKEMTFWESWSNNLKAFSISSWDSFSLYPKILIFSNSHFLVITILVVIICKNSLKSIVLSFSLSFSSVFKFDTNFLISSFLGSNPRALRATFNSLTSMAPAWIC